MSKNCSIMTRIKSNYENRSKTFLTRRTPVICRIDGKAFDFNTKAYQFIYDEYIYNPNFVRLTSTSATINVIFSTSKIKPGVKGELIIFS